MCVVEVVPAVCLVHMPALCCSKMVRLGTGRLAWGGKDRHQKGTRQKQDGKKEKSEVEQGEGELK